MGKGAVVHSEKVRPFVCDETYSSKMLLDDGVAGTQAININEGTLKGGCKTAGGVHEENEIYYMVKGEAVLHLDDDACDVRPGSVAFIPAGVFHWLENKSATEDFVILTLWEKAEFNETWHARLAAWGKSFAAVDEG